MQHEWLNQNQSNALIVFFNGWGMDKESVSHLTENNILHKSYDVLHFFDYRDCSLPSLDLSRYSEKILIAWSMGVYMSSLFPFKCGLKIGLCGTSPELQLDLQNGCQARQVPSGVTPTLKPLLLMENPQPLLQKTVKKY